MNKFLSIAAAAVLCSGILQTKEAATIPPQWAGNGHYDELILGSVTSCQALTQAGSMTHLGATNHLVTTTSAGEQSFLNTLAGGEPNNGAGGNAHVAVGNWSFNGCWNNLQGTQELSYVVKYSIDVP